MDPCQTVQHIADRASGDGVSSTDPAHLLKGQRLHLHRVSPAGLYTSHARRLEVWHRVSGQGGRSGTLHPAGQSSDKGAAGGAEPLAAPAAALFGLSPDS